jgi:AcrR family transcriptional regulator
MKAEMARNYTLKRRAESQAETRQRIVEAAVELHSTVGPSATTVSMIAEKAGVQRHTLYNHFPDDRSMAMACSGLTEERDPLPDAAPWRAVTDPADRLRAGLRAIYDWYARNESLMACVMRDMETYELVREISALRYAPKVRAWQDVLGAGLKSKQRALLALALSFHTWRTLTRDAGMKQGAAVNTMVEAICA